jgi:type IV secretion system protein VirB9
MKTITLLAAAGIVLPALGARLPEQTGTDPHIRYFLYSKDDVTVIEVQRGAATRIVLAEDEKIVKDGVATGFPSDCSKKDLEWCVRADIGTSQVYVKPKDGATHNNLELKTDLHDYSFAFRVLPDPAPVNKSKPVAKLPETNVPMYRVIVRYPPRMPTLAVSLARTTSADDRSTLTERLERARPVPKNWRYAMQMVAGSRDIVPSLIFDDGRFTYFRFPANREIPTIYAVSSQGEESRVNFHMDAADGSLAVVEKMGRRFVLRLGTSAVGIWNDAFDPNGVPPSDGTTVSGVVRVLREGK